MIIPEMNSYITALGGAGYKGLIIGLFTVAAFISRPFSGKLADTVGRIPVIFVGTFVCFALGALYPFVHTVAAFLMLRFFHGFSTGFQPTGTTAYLADTIPVTHRGQAMGYLGIAGTLGMGSGPFFGSLISAEFGLDAMFYASSLAALGSIVSLGKLRETLQNKSKFSWSLLAVWKEKIYDERVMPATLSMLFSAFCFGLFLTIVPDLSDHLNVPNRGTIFLYFTISSLASRLLAGKASDRFGREPLILIALALIITGMWLLAISETKDMFFWGGILFGLGSGINTPTIFAWTIDLGNEKNRAKGVATVYMGLEAGIFFGSVLSAWIYNNRTENFTATFIVGGIMALIAFILVLYYNKALKKVT